MPTSINHTPALTDKTWSAAVGHYENFPVSSWLCPRVLRPAVQALYHFARTADDLADEGNATAAQRLDALGAYRQALAQVLSGQGDSKTMAWPKVFGPLQIAIASHQLPGDCLHALLDAFEQDVRHTEAQHRYANTDELLHYCERSANPVGRLLLHLQGVGDALALERSDAISSGLQLINCWQDLSVDWARQRHYLPRDLLDQHGLDWSDFSPLVRQNDWAQRHVVQTLCAQARSLMNAGAPLVHQMPGRMGWELRLVVQGGLRMIDRIEAIEHRTWLQRPTLQTTDWPLCVWRSLFM
ncbi:MAG: All-trans-phytoene synthase/15-cis-phytoene synthase [Pseudomonadota bacterium]|jgi:squalene synthase HpnC